LRLLASDPKRAGLSIQVERDGARIAQPRDVGAGREHAVGPGIRVAPIEVSRLCGNDGRKAVAVDPTPEYEERCPVLTLYAAIARSGRCMPIKCACGRRSSIS
jgi:hypothetical protein